MNNYIRELFMSENMNFQDLYKFSKIKYKKCYLISVLSFGAKYS